MSESVGQTEVEDWRRLTACPGCDYSLETLPVEGVCPECGRAYDQRFVVLTGQGRGRWDGAAGGTWRGIVGQGVAFAALLWFLSSTRQLLWSPQFVAVGGMMGAMVVAQLYARLFSAREPGMQLWMSPEGVAQVLSTPEARRARSIVEGLSLFFAPILYAGMVFGGRNGMGWFALAFFAFLMSFSVAEWRARRRREGNAGGADYVPGLWSWREIERVQVKTLSDERVRVRCMVRRRWWWIVVRDEWVIDIEIACPANVAESLGRQMVGWCPTAGAVTS